MREEEIREMHSTRNAVIALASLLFVLGSSLPAAGAPRIAFLQEAVDYGPLPYGKMVSHIFHFTNVGDEPLRITGKFNQEGLIMSRVLKGC